MLRLWIGFCLLFIGPVPNGALEWKWKENDEFWVEFSSEKDEKVQLGEKEQKRRETVAAVFQVTVRKVADGAPTLGVRVHKFDFIGGRSRPVADALEGSDFEVTLDKSLAVTRFAGLDKVIRGMPGSENSGEDRLKFLQSVAETMNRYWLAELLLAMPNKATNSGDQWEQQSALDMPTVGRMAVQRSLKDDGTANEGGKELRKIAVDLKFEWTPSEAEDGILAFKIQRIETKRSECTTAALFDPEAGRLLKSSSKHKYALTLKTLVAGAARDVGLERDQKLELRVLDKSPLQ